MNDREIMEAAVKRIFGDVKPVDSRPWWRRLLASLRVKVSGAPPNKVEVTGGAEF
jgi:hypothetical protein